MTGIFDFKGRRREAEKKKAEEEGMKEIEEDIDKLKTDIKKEDVYFWKVADLEQKKWDIHEKIHRMWWKYDIKTWKKAEDFVKITIPELIRKQQKLIEGDLKLIEDEKIVLKLIKKEIDEKEGIGAKAFMDALPNEAKNLFLTKEKELEDSMTKMFIPVNKFFKELKEYFEKQLSLFNKESAWSLITSHELFSDMSKKNERIQYFFRITFNGLVDSILFKIMSFKAELEFDAEDPEAIKDLFKRIKAHAGFHVYLNESGYKTVAQQNLQGGIRGDVRADLERVVNWIGSIIGNKLQVYAPWLNDKGFEDYDEALCYEIKNILTEKVLETGDKERPTIFIYYLAKDSRKYGRKTLIHTTLIAGAEDAAKLLTCFRKNLNLVYNFSRSVFSKLFNDELFKRYQPERNGKMVFVDMNISEIFKLSKEFESSGFIVGNDGLSRFAIQYQLEDQLNNK